MKLATAMPIVFNTDIGNYDYRRDLYHSSWVEHYKNTDIPLYILLMGTLDSSYYDNCGFKIFKTENRYHPIIARAILEEIILKDGFDHINMIDDDFLIDNSYHYNLQNSYKEMIALGYSRSSLSNKQRPIFSEFKNLNTIKKYYNRINERLLYISPGPKNWHPSSNDVTGSSLWIREGIIHEVGDYSISLFDTFKNIPDKNKEYSTPEDIIILKYLSTYNKILVQVIDGVQHQIKGQKINFKKDTIYLRPKLTVSQFMDQLEQVPSIIHNLS